MNDCIFCTILETDNPQKKNIFYENSVFVAMFVLYPETKGHFIVFPKKHASELSEMKNHIGRLMKLSVKLAEKWIKKLNAKAYILRLNNKIYTLETDNPLHVGHIHMHVIPRYSKNDVMGEIPPQKPQPYFDELLALKRA